MAKGGAYGACRALVKPPLRMTLAGRCSPHHRGWVGRQLLRTTTLEPDFGFLPNPGNDALLAGFSRQRAGTGGAFFANVRGAPPHADTYPATTILDMPTSVRVHVDALIAAQHDMGVCDAIEQMLRVPRRKAGLRHRLASGRKFPAMSPAHVRKVAGTDPPVPPRRTLAPLRPHPGPRSSPPPPHLPLPSHRSPPVHRHRPSSRPAARPTMPRPYRTGSRAGCATSSRCTNSPSAWPAPPSSTTRCTRCCRPVPTLVGARRGLIVLEPADGLGPDITIGLGLGPRRPRPHRDRPPRGRPHPRTAGTLDPGRPDAGGRRPREPSIRDLARPGLDPRHREVAAASASPPATRSRSPPTPPAASAPPSGSTTSARSPSSASAT